MNWQEINTLYLRRLEQAEVLAPGSAAALIRGMGARKELDVKPSAFVGTVVAYLLGTGMYGADSPETRQAERYAGELGGVPHGGAKPHGRHFLTEATEKATARGGGLSRALPFLGPLLSYHQGGKLVDSLADDLEVLEPQAAASSVADKLLTARDAREACHADFRPELPASELRVKEVLGKLASEYGVELKDPVGVAARWGQEVGRNHYKVHDLARVIITRLANQDAGLLEPGTAEVPKYCPFFWGEIESRTRKQSPNEGLMANPQYASFFGDGEGPRAGG